MTPFMKRLSGPISTRSDGGTRQSAFRWIEQACSKANSCSKGSAGDDVLPIRILSSHRSQSAEDSAIDCAYNRANG
jgi:hypothetical protein